MVVGAASVMAPLRRTRARFRRVRLACASQCLRRLRVNLRRHCVSGGKLSGVLAALFALSAAPALATPLERDSAGRLLAPVAINGSGPYRLVLDTGANRTAVTPEVARELGLTHRPAEEVLSVSGAMQ